MQTTSSVKFFEELIIKNNNNTNIHEQCCKYMTYEKLSKDETLFEIGKLILIPYNNIILRIIWHEILYNFKWISESFSKCK